MTKKKGQDITELTERAKVLAEATGRAESDVLADLLDDGFLNNSHKTEDKDLVTQLKEAAALISTVQEINTDISNNKVLNGGDNTTSVKVETTLEGDIVDRAIASAQKKAEELKTLIATLIPIFLLITGGGMEAFGVINILEDGAEISPIADSCVYGIDWADWIWENDELNVFGNLWTDCENISTDSLETMVVMANAFDSEVPNPEWVFGNIDIYDWEQDSNFHIELGDAPDKEITIWVDLFIRDDFDNGGIPIAQTQLTGVQKPVEIVRGCMNSNAENYNPQATEDDGSCEYPPEPIQGCTDSDAENYNEEATEDDGSCEYPPEEPCEVEITNHYRGHISDDEEQDAILIAFRIVPTNCENEELEIDIELYQNGFIANYTHYIVIAGDDDTDINHIFDGVAVGNSWIPKITASLDDEILEQVNFWGIDVEAQDPEFCEIIIFSINIQTNSTNATVGFDLDCGEQPNEFEGYNITVQFLVYNVNQTISEAGGEGPLQWIEEIYYIQGYVADYHYLFLDDYAQNNTTHYDFYWYAMWEDGEGYQQLLEEKWLNRQVTT